MNAFAWITNQLNNPHTFARDIMSLCATGGSPGLKYEMGKLLVDEPEPEPKKSGTAGNALGVALSWEREEVKAARLHRDVVRVTVGEDAKDYVSVGKAFEFLGLPKAKHIRFRMKLKASGKEVFEWNGQNYYFDII